jgi:hypothetical protein
MSFQLPIEYLNHEKKHILRDDLNADLELEKFINQLFSPKTCAEQRVATAWRRYHTTDISYLTTLQECIADFSGSNDPHTELHTEVDPEVTAWWEDLHGQKPEHFREVNHYVTMEKLHFLNFQEFPLQVLSLMTLASPILALITPFLLLLIPFFILRLQKHHISFGNYWSTLKNLFSKLPLGGIFSLTDSSMSFDKKMYALMSAGFYIFQLYQNSQSCYKFYRQSKVMVKHLGGIKEHCLKSAAQMKWFRERYTGFDNLFLESLKDIIAELEGFAREVETIQSTSWKIVKLGHMMKLTYMLKFDPVVTYSIESSMDFTAFIKNLRRLGELRSAGVIKPCSFGDELNRFTMSGVVYPPLALAAKDSQTETNTDSWPIPNSISLKKNKILSGPNASGKTTLIKSLLINTILSQQVGYGFYKKATICPIEHVYSYINIPDSSDRDSLFQAEARRCKEILERIEEHPKEQHLAVFDELFSGTNPYEAMSAGVGYLNHLKDRNNVRFLLTTHFIDLCKEYQATSTTQIENMHMAPGYKLKRGISQTRGGLKVLKDLAFPESILEEAEAKLSSFD